MASGVDTSDWDCPVEIDELEEKIVEENWECDVCHTEQPTGTTFYGHEDSEWDVCEYCYAGEGENTVMEQYRLEHQNISVEEMMSRMKKLDAIQDERDKDREAVEITKASQTFGSPTSAEPAGETGADDSDSEWEPGAHLVFHGLLGMPQLNGTEVVFKRVLPDGRVEITQEDGSVGYCRRENLRQTVSINEDEFRIGAMVKTFFNVLGQKSEKDTFGTIEAINDDGTIKVYLDNMEKTQSIPPDWIAVTTPEQQARLEENAPRILRYPATAQSHKQKKIDFSSVQAHIARGTAPDQGPEYVLWQEQMFKLKKQKKEEFKYV